MNNHNLPANILDDICDIMLFFDKHHIPLIFTGGIAVACYTGVIRTLFADYDFFVPLHYQSLIENIFNIKAHRYVNKTTFHSYKINTLCNKKEVDIIFDQHILPSPKSIESDSIEVSYMTAFDSLHYKAIDTMSIPCCSPELLMMTKLIAWRSKSIGKYDIEDVKALIPYIHRDTLERLIAYHIKDTSIKSLLYSRLEGL